MSHASKLITILLTIAAILCVLFAWRFVLVLDPESPLIPFALCFLGGVAFRQAFE